MILLDRPYASDFLHTTIADNALPVVMTAAARKLGLAPGPHVLDENTALASCRAAHLGGDLKLYTNSENALAWIADNLAFTGLPEKIELFKDKARFRKLTGSLFPDFFYREVAAADLAAVDPAELPLPVILKPNVGFFSLGVHKINTVSDWQVALESLDSELGTQSELYPEQVLDTKSFLIEEYVEGDEFALDAYFDAEGSPVILNILKHVFSSEDDVSDRIYTTSKQIIEQNLDQFTQFLAEMGRLSGVKNFPVHVELRLSPEGTLVPIEINPLRFGGWCTTADLTMHAYGFNPYLYFLRGRSPDWTRILADKDGVDFSIVVLDNSTGIEPERILEFDHARLLEKFTKPLELRKIDHRQFGVFGFLFVETGEDDFRELESILRSDLREFITT